MRKPQGTYAKIGHGKHIHKCKKQTRHIGGESQVVIVTSVLGGERLTRGYAARNALILLESCELYKHNESISPPITDLIITTCDFHKDLLDWNISPVNDGFDAKALFNMYITKRINDKRLELLESCKLYKIFRLEPRFDDEVHPADENSKVEEAEEKKE
ncbi:hypothetical protein Tco_0579535 [Tanacetum coccineum]